MNGGPIVQWNIETRINELKTQIKREPDNEYRSHLRGMIFGLREAQRQIELSLGI